MTSPHIPKPLETKLSRYTELKNKLELFITGLIQICLVTSNTYLIAREIYWAIFVIGFLISFIWSYNVKKIAFGSVWDRLAYSFGAACGGIIGLHLIKLFI